MDAYRTLCNKAAMNTIKQIKYAGRRPVTSENVAIIIVSLVWGLPTIYEVRVRFKDKDVWRSVARAFKAG